MLVAEIHGLYVPEARESEDYLTSAVFGHLRYIKPGAFWDVLFDLAICQPIGSKSITASESIRRETGHSLSKFASMEAIFWPEHRLGIPDLILYFSGLNLRPVVILIEAKLNAVKSGCGEYDQLARYLRILDSLADLRPPLPSHALALVVYLTAIDSRAEVIESLAQYGDNPQARRRLYRLQWQDLIRAIDATRTSSETESLILSDIRAFLQRRDLEYFSGMDGVANVPAVIAADGDFLRGDTLFEIGVVPSGIEGIEERWMRAE